MLDITSFAEVVEADLRHYALTIIFLRLSRRAEVSIAACGICFHFNAGNLTLDLVQFTARENYRDCH
jgi:hypothetical protein